MAKTVRLADRLRETFSDTEPKSDFLQYEPPPGDPSVWEELREVYKNFLKGQRERTLEDATRRAAVPLPLLSTATKAVWEHKFALPKEVPQGVRPFITQPAQTPIEGMEGKFAQVSKQTGQLQPFTPQAASYEDISAETFSNSPAGLIAWLAAPQPIGMAPRISSIAKAIEKGVPKVAELAKAAGVAVPKVAKELAVEEIGAVGKGAKAAKGVVKEAESALPLKEPPLPATALKEGIAPGKPVTLYHGTKAEYIDADITTGKRMYGIHLTTDENVAKTYGKIKRYTLSKDAKTLDLSDGDTLWEFMKKEGILDKEDIANIDLENYVKNGQLFQYDISSKTYLADDVAKTAESQGYDVVKMADDLGGGGDNTAYVVVNKSKLHSPEPGGAVPPSVGSLARIQDMLGAKPNTIRDWNEIGLKLQENINDSYYGLRRLQGQIEKTKPIQAGTQKDIITAITRSPGAANAGLTRYEMAVSQMKKLAPDANVTDISTVLFSEHGKEILAEKGAKRVLPGGVNTPEQLDQALIELKAKLGEQKYQQVYKAAEVVRDIYATERQRLVTSGLISKELGDALAKQYPWYNPLRYLDFVESEAMKGRVVKPISVSASGLKRLSEIGSEKAIVDPLTSLPTELIKNEVRIQKNDLAKGIIKLAKDDPTLGITKRKITIPVAQVEGEPVFRPQHGEIPGTISFFENGKRQVYDIPEWMYRETAVLTQSINNPAASFIGALNGISRAAFTTFSPAFTVANMMNDMLPALVRGGVFPTATARRLALSFRSIESDALMQSYRLSGAYQGRFYGKDATEIAKQVGASGGKVIGKNFDLKKAVLEAIPNLGEKGEQASRIAVFEKNLNKTLPNWREMTPEAVAVTPQARKAAADAVEATINFGRGGYAIRSANPFVIFLNASMEGTKLPFRTLRDSVRARWTLAGLGAGMAGLSAYNMSYPEYFDVPDRVRWGSVMVMLPSTKKDIEGKPVPKYLTVIPNTREWAAFFAPLVYGMEKTLADNPTEFLQFAKALIPQISPVGNLPLPEVVSEGVEQLTNYDLYRGTPIVSQGKVNLPATEQTGPYVSSAVEKTSQAMGLSPLRVQHALQAIFGGAGTGALSVIDMVVGAKNQRGIDLKTRYDALPSASKAEWMEKLSSTDKSALIAAINQPQQNVPILSAVASRFYREQGGQLTQNDWDKFDRAVEDTNKQFSGMEKVKALGIRLGSVGDSLDLKPGASGGSVGLTPAQRAEYQRLMSGIVIKGVEQYIATLSPSLSAERQKELIQSRITSLKTLARTKFLQAYRAEQQPPAPIPLPPSSPLKTTMPDPAIEERLNEANIRIRRQTTMPGE